MIASAIIVLIAMAFFCKSCCQGSGSGLRVLGILSALAAGFWLFSFFRYVGLVQWPLAHPANLPAYSRLLYFHFVLSITVLAPMLVVARMTKPNAMVSWGNWKKGFLAFPGKCVLVLCSAGCWIWASYVVLSVKPDTSGSIIGLIAICTLKAFLTGATEEICYRGFIQSAAIDRFGIPLGIILQSCLYTAFHMHLGEAFFSQTAFLAAVMALGLVFGAVTHLTSGIGWAGIVHIALNVVIEWRNLCSIL